MAVDVSLILDKFILGLNNFHSMWPEALTQLPDVNKRNYAPSSTSSRSRLSRIQHWTLEAVILLSRQSRTCSIKYMSERGASQSIRWTYSRPRNPLTPLALRNWSLSTIKINSEPNAPQSGWTMMSKVPYPYCISVSDPFWILYSSKEPTLNTYPTQADLVCQTNRVPITQSPCLTPLTLPSVTDV